MAVLMKTDTCPVEMSSMCLPKPRFFLISRESYDGEAGKGTAKSRESYQPPDYQVTNQQLDGLIDLTHSAASAIMLGNGWLGFAASGRLGLVADYEHILYAVEGPMALITINRAHKHNAISLATLDELQHAVAIAGDDEAVRVITITGAGDRAFASGSDLRLRPRFGASIT